MNTTFPLRTAVAVPLLAVFLLASLNISCRKEGGTPRAPRQAAVSPAGTTAGRPDPTIGGRPVPGGGLGPGAGPIVRPGSH